MYDRAREQRGDVRKGKETSVGAKPETELERTEGRERGTETDRHLERKKYRHLERHNPIERDNRDLQTE